MRVVGAHRRGLEAGGLEVGECGDDGGRSTRGLAGEVNEGAVVSRSGVASSACSKMVSSSSSVMRRLTTKVMSWVVIVLFLTGVVPDAVVDILLLLTQPLSCVSVMDEPAGRTLQGGATGAGSDTGTNGLPGVRREAGGFRPRGRAR